MLTYSEQSDRSRETIEVEDELADEALEARAKETFDYEWNNGDTMIPLKHIKALLLTTSLSDYARLNILNALRFEVEESEIARIIREGDFL